MKTDAGKVPHHIQLPDRQPLALGGIWEDWPGPNGVIRTVAIGRTCSKSSSERRSS